MIEFIKLKNMKNMIKVNDSKFGGDVFYGSININGNSVSVSNICAAKRPVSNP